MSKVTRFEDLHCWQEARILANYVYDLCEIPALARKYKLRDQLESAALAVMNNVAEGFGRFGKKDFIRFLNIASSSCCELKSMSYLLFDRKIINSEKLSEFHLKIEITISKILGLVRYLGIQLKKLKSNAK